MNADRDIPLTPQKHEVAIEYCVPCDYSAHALGAAEDLIQNHQHIIDRLVFKMGSKGVFKVSVDGEVLFSKHQTQRHPDPGEVLKRFQEFVEA